MAGVSSLPNRLINPLFGVDNALCCICRKCNKPNVLHYSIENGTEIYALCAACFRPDDVKWDSIQEKLSLARTCAKCGQEATIETFMTGCTFVRLPGQPCVRKITCSAACRAALEDLFPPGPPGEVLKRCAHCGTYRRNIKKCSGCKIAKYCDAKCQADAWTTHKPLCSFKPPPVDAEKKTVPSPSTTAPSDRKASEAPATS
jgi:hypothetical protein